MAVRTFKPKKAKKAQKLNSGELPIDKPVAVYYRQSTDAQVGNLSTSIQTVDMVADLEKRGWKHEDIILIDMDEGVSGTTRIDERAGMSQLFELITDEQIGAVACQDEDRLFRDITQIQVNIFIEACRKAGVLVITPFFVYDFSHELHGDFHARQFRFKSEMAAEYIKSYILGRLTPAKARMAREGKWVGAKMPVGYMVDIRKKLPNGSDNPNWRKFVPFEPYAEVVRAYFDIFLETGGNLRRTLRLVRERKITFPDCTPPEGYKTSYQLKWRDDGYYPRRGSVKSMLINPAYIGHWCYRGEVLIADNHDPIVDVDVFMTAFNYLSKYTMQGEKNPNHTPGRYDPSITPRAERLGPPPVCANLIHSDINGNMVRASVMWDKRAQSYLYTMRSSEPQGHEVIWARHADWIDQHIIYHLLHKLRATFQLDAWTEAVSNINESVEKEQKLKRAQLRSLEAAMKNLIDSIAALSNARMIQEVQNKYEEMEAEQKRLESDIQNLEQQRHQQFDLARAEELFEQAIQNWDSLSGDEQQDVLGLLIDRIDAVSHNRVDFTLTIYWQDNSNTEIELGQKPKTSDWSYEHIQLLKCLVENGASQLQIAKAFPNLKWYQIRYKIDVHCGNVKFPLIYLHKTESYEDYVANGSPDPRKPFWQTDDDEMLRQLVEDGANQEEVMRVFRYRTWRSIRARIRKLMGNGVEVENSGIDQYLSYAEVHPEEENVHLEPCSEIEVRCS